METKIIEATNGTNWGKFLIGRMDHEWQRRSVISESSIPLLRQIGWGTEHLWVLDLQTGEGASFRVHRGGHARNDLERHRIWVCPLYEPFLWWLYAQPNLDLAALPETVQLEADSALWGYRRSGTEGSR